MRGRRPLRTINIVIPWESKEDIRLGLLMVDALNRVYGPPPAPLLSDAAGIEYGRGPEIMTSCDEQFLTWPVLYHLGKGDCKSLASALAAETGGHSVVYRASPEEWHVVTELPDGTLADPSAALGMLAFYRKGRR